MLRNQKRARLILSDGTLFDGWSMGREGTAVGEVVFDTAMVGYQEILTDPKHSGQLVAQTFPLIGNYGVNREDVSSERCQCNGYIVREWCKNPSNFRMEGNIDDYLNEQGVVGISGIDTRALTRHLCRRGTVCAMITTSDIDAKEALSEIGMAQEQGEVE